MGEYMGKEEKFYTVEEVTKHFKVSRYAIIRAVNSGRLKVHHKEGRFLMFSEEGIKEYISTSM